MTELIGDDASAELVEDVISRISTNVSMLVDREIEIESVTIAREYERPAGPGVVHLSFKLLFTGANGLDAEGCVLVPLPDAISLACYLMMLSESEVEANRRSTELDGSTKDAMLELGNFIGAAVNESVRIHVPGASARANRCQGVRADVRPAFAYTEGDELVVARAATRLGGFPKFEIIAMLPAATLGE